MVATALYGCPSLTGCSGAARELNLSWEHESEGPENFIDAAWHKLSSWLLVLTSEASRQLHVPCAEMCCQGAIVMLDEKGTVIGKMQIQEEIPLAICVCRLSDFAVGTKSG
eukprot:748838-Hanusia_phi.AAC.10